MIDIVQLKGMAYEEVVDLLLGENKQPLELAVPKDTIQTENTREEMMYDFLRSAYVGQQISDMSEEFLYDPLGPEEEGQIRFVFNCKDIDGLAKKLIELAPLYYDPFLAYEPAIADKLNSLIAWIKKERIMPACGELLEHYVTCSFMGNINIDHGEEEDQA